MEERHRKIINKTFQTGILLKFFFGFCEIFAGIILAFFGRPFIVFIQEDILRNSQVFPFNFLISALNDIMGELQIFFIIYLIFHGVVNITMVFLILKKKLWAYPATIYLFSAFLVYQIYKYVQTQPLWLLLLTIFDIFVVFFIFLEYRNKTKELKEA